MNRRGAKFIFAATLALLAACISLWFVSYFQNIVLSLIKDEGIDIGVKRGLLYVYRRSDSGTGPQWSTASLWIANPKSDTVPPQSRLLPGFEFRPWKITPVMNDWIATVRLYWPVLALAAIAIAQYHRLKRRLPPFPLCPTCHYDCRAIPARCPECGQDLTTDGSAK